MSCVIRMCHGGLPWWHIKIWCVMTATWLEGRTDTQWHMQWHIAMTYPHDRYVHDISNDICFNSTLQGHIPITYQKRRQMDGNHMSWDMSLNHMSWDMSSGYVMNYFKVYVIRYVINKGHDSICHAHISLFYVLYVMSAYVMGMCHHRICHGDKSCVCVMKICRRITSCKHVI